MLCEGPDKKSGKRAVVLVEPGWHKGVVRFADEKPEYKKIKITLDLDDGRRCKFNIKSVQGKAVLKALGISGDVLNPEDLEGQTLEVNFDRWKNEDGVEYNTFKDIKPAGDSVGVGSPSPKPVEAPVPQAPLAGEAIPF